MRWSYFNSLIEEFKPTMHWNAKVKVSHVGHTLLLIHLIAGLLTLYLMWAFEHDATGKILIPLKRQSRQKRSGMLDVPEGSKIDTLELVPGRYWIYRRKANWHAAGKFCEADNRDLATFPDKRDAELVIDAIYKISHYSIEYEMNKRKEEFGLDREYWMGLYDSGHEGRWEWLNNGFLTYQDMWTKGQPDHVNEQGDQLSGRPQHCAGLWNPVFYKNTAERPQKHTFDDKECTHTLYFLCGKAGEPKPPPIHDPQPDPTVTEPKPTAAPTTPPPPSQQTSPPPTPLPTHPPAPPATPLPTTPPPPPPSPTPQPPPSPTPPPPPSPTPPPPPSPTPPPPPSPTPPPPPSPTPPPPPSPTPPPPPSPTPPPPPSPTPPPPPSPTPPPPPESCPNTCDDPNRYHVAETDSNGNIICVDGHAKCRETTKCERFCMTSQGDLLTRVIKENCDQLWECYHNYKCPEEIVEKIKEVIEKNNWTQDGVGSCLTL